MNALPRILARFTFLRYLALTCVLACAASPALAAKTYSDNGDGTVTDPTTGLTWMRCSMGQTWNGSTCTGTASTYTFDQANALTGTVNFAGQSDWRLPNIRELQTIVDRSASDNANDAVVFPNTPASYFWSASAVASGSGGAWVVYFGYGGAGGSVKESAYQVRLVRAGQSFGLLDIGRPSTDYVDQGDGTVTHTPTSLTWQRCAVGQTWTGSTCSGTASVFTWDAAKVLTSSFAGQADWRLPTEEELLTLVDYSQYSPAINATLFPNAPAASFWSASADAYYSDNAWYVYFSYGEPSSYYKGNYFLVRLVRAGQSFDAFALTVTKVGNGSVTGSALTGISCGSTCAGTYTSGTSVTLIAIPEAGSTFAGWSGACSGTGTCTVNMNQAQSVTATFVVNNVTEYLLSVNKLGSGLGTVTGSYVQCGAICSVYLTAGTSVTLTATADPDSAFSGWSGACSGTGTCTVSMDQAQNVTATFMVNIIYTVTVTNSGAGSGTVASSPTGINCGTVCAMVYPGGTSVTLSATADAGSTFSGWSGAGCSGTGTCTMLMNQAQSVTATFTVNGYTLVVTKLGTGTGTVTATNIYCGTVCAMVYPGGTSVTLSATADAGSTFSGWSGACSGTGTCTVSMNQAQSVTATFVISTVPGFSLSVNKAGFGSGTITATNIYCGTICWGVYPSGTSVTLTATADSGSTFSGWSGAGCSGTGTCTMLMNQAQSVTAVFTASYTLTVNMSGTGSGGVVSSPFGINCGALCNASFTSGTSVTLIATPDSGSTFSGWSGACSGTGTCIVLMNQAQNATATFVVNSVAKYLLSVNKAGTGTGTVRSWAFICGDVCSYSFTSGTTVPLSATADSGSTFAGWSGAGCSGTGACTVSMNQAQNVTATFTASSAVLPTAPTNITAIAGNSSISVSFTPGSTGSGTLITYEAACGKVSDGSWNSTNLTYGSGLSSPITVNGLSNGTAYYCWALTESTLGYSPWSVNSSSVTPTAASSYALTVIKLGSGIGTVTAWNINCGPVCSVVYINGTSVTLTATATTGSTFFGWSGACSGTAATCTVSMSQAQNVTATFTFSGSGLYDGIYLWDDNHYLSIHQIVGGTLIGTIYWNYTANSVQIGTRTILTVDTFDLLQGQITGSSATISGLRFYRACTLSYDLTFNSDSSLTVRLNSVSNSPGVNTADVNCVAQYNPAGFVWTIPRIF